MSEQPTEERTILISPKLLATITAPGYLSQPVRVSATDDGRHLDFVFHSYHCESCEYTDQWADEGLEGMHDART